MSCLLRLLLRSFVVAAAAWGACGRAADPPSPAPAEREADGMLTHRLTSEFQPGETQVRVLLPSSVEPDRLYPVVYLLPVEAGREQRYGDALTTARALRAADRFRVILVAPTFAQLPWYADHPTDTAIRQESHFIRVVLPLVERTYPAERSATGRLLLGFSKSGWGAWSLALRHAELFGAAASWDAPLSMDAPGKYGSGPIFGTEENFHRYQITRLLEQIREPRRSGSRLGQDVTAATAGRACPRLILHGYGNFLDHRVLHEQLNRLGIAHAYRDGPKSEHIWSADWLEPALAEVTKRP